MNGKFTVRHKQMEINEQHVMNGHLPLKINVLAFKLRGLLFIVV